MVNGAGSAMMHSKIQAYCLLAFARTQPKRPSITHPDMKPDTRTLWNSGSAHDGMPDESSHNE